MSRLVLRKARTMTTTEPAAAAKKNGTVEHKGQTLAWEQMVCGLESHRDTGRTVYRAMAQDPAGNRFAVLWPLKPEIAALPADERPEDESDYCDWSAPESVEAYRGSVSRTAAATAARLAKHREGAR